MYVFFYVQKRPRVVKQKNNWNAEKRIDANCAWFWLGHTVFLMMYRMLDCLNEANVKEIGSDGRCGRCCGCSNLWRDEMWMVDVWFVSVLLTTICAVRDIAGSMILDWIIWNTFLFLLLVWFSFSYLKKCYCFHNSCIIRKYWQNNIAIANIDKRFIQNDQFWMRCRLKW